MPPDSFLWQPVQKDRKHLSPNMNRINRKNPTRHSQSLRSLAACVEHVSRLEERRHLSAGITVDRSRVFFSDVVQSTDSNPSLVQRVRITNTGSVAVSLGSNPVAFTGSNSGDFSVQTSSGFNSTLSPGQTATADLVFRAGAIGIRSATLTASTVGGQTDTSSLRGLGTAGNGGNNEPSLQRILDLYQIPLTVGDSNPNDTDFPVPPNTPNDEVVAPRFTAANANPVVVEVLANFAGGTSPSTRFGFYDAGTLQTRTQLFTINQANAQTVAPIVTGTTSFSPTRDFGIYAEYPDFSNRIATSEDALNTWEGNASNRKKIRFYPLEDVNGNTVPNAYVFGTEDWDQAFDFNDIVGIIRNVNIAPSGPELGIENLDYAPFADRLVFNRIRDLDTNFPNDVHDTATLRVRNTGSSTLNVTSTNISNADFQITSGGGNFSLSAGQTRNIVVNFVFNRSGLGNEIRNANLTLATNDSNEASQVIQLSGLWQSHSEDAPGNGSQEPNLQTIIDTFGYDIEIGDTQANQGNVVKDGEEVLSPFFLRADAGRDVSVRMLAGFHRQANDSASTIRYYTPNMFNWGDFTNANRLFRHRPEQGQSYLAAIDSDQNSPAFSSFNPGAMNQQFGFRVDSHWSDPGRNQNEDFGVDNDPDGGQAIRVFAAKDRQGNIIPDTYIIAHDYTGLTFSNYDYQDNIYLVSNVKPASAPTAPASLSTTDQLAGIRLQWAANTEGNLAGYIVLRSTSVNGTFADISDGPINLTNFTDTNVAGGTTYFYRVIAADYHGSQSTAATISASRGNDTTPPAAPTNLTASGASNGITLNWNNPSDGDFAGIRVFRSGSSNGTFTLLTSSPLTNTSTYLDAAAPQGVQSFYRVAAVDQSDNQSTFATANATRPTGSSAPAAPSSLALSFNSGVRIAWNDNSNNETSFRLERQIVGQINWTRLSNVAANSEVYTDRNSAASTQYTYRVRASSSAGNSAWVRGNFTTPAANSFTSRTVGSPAPAGNTTVVLANRNYDLASTGDVDGTSDRFRFVSQSFTGNFDVRVTVSNLTGPRDTSFAGLMLRTGTGATDPNLTIRNTKASGLRVTQRVTTGGPTSTPASTDSAISSVRLRLRRVGANITASYWNTTSNDWTVLRTTTQSFGSTVQVGMIIASRSTSSTQAAAQFRDLTVA